MSETVGIRELKAHLSRYVARARDGGTVLVTDRGTVVARLVPPGADPVTLTLREKVAAAGLSWLGGKPLGLDPAAAPRLDASNALSQAILEDRE